MRAANRRRTGPIDIAVGARIRNAPPGDRFQQTQLAESLGITFQQVQKYERGPIGCPRRCSSGSREVGNHRGFLVGETARRRRGVAVRATSPPPTISPLSTERITNTDSRRALVTLAKALAIAHP